MIINVSFMYNSKNIDMPSFEDQTSFMVNRM